MRIYGGSSRVTRRREDIVSAQIQILDDEGPQDAAQHEQRDQGCRGLEVTEDVPEELPVQVGSDSAHADPGAQDQEKDLGVVLVGVLQQDADGQHTEMEQ